MSREQTRWQALGFFALALILFVCTLIIIKWAIYFTNWASLSSGWAQVIGSMAAIFGSFLLGRSQARSAHSSALASARHAHKLAALRTHEAALAVGESVQVRCGKILKAFPIDRIDMLGFELAYDERGLVGLMSELDSFRTQEIGSVDAIRALLQLRVSTAYFHSNLVHARTVVDKAWNSPGGEWPKFDRGALDLNYSNIRKCVDTLRKEAEPLRVEAAAEK